MTLWHEGPCIPHPDHEVDVPCAVCYAANYHVEATVRRIAEWLRDGGQNSWCAHNAFPTIEQTSWVTGERQTCVTPVDADTVAAAIEKGEWR